MNKKDLRQKQISRLQDFAKTEQKELEDQQLLDKILSWDELKNSQTVGVTSSLAYEVDTSRLIALLWDQGKDVYLAKAYNNSEHSQDFLYYSYMTKLTTSKFGVVEVDDPDAKVNNDLDLIIVPGLAFAKDTHQRLGFGGGYYDRFLVKHQQTKTVALVNSQMIFNKTAWDVEQTDVPMQTIITPDAVL